MLPANTNKNTGMCLNGARFFRQAAMALIGLITPAVTMAQNLVPNPGFEETDSCTFGLGLGALHDWYSASITPDHLQSCQPYGSANSLPLNIATFQYPYEGGSCAGLITFDGHTGEEQREWLMVSLLDTLVPGATYYCSLRANAAFGGNGWNPINWLASSNLGMLFTTYDRHWSWGDPLPSAMNQAQILYPQVLSDTVDWTLVSGSFVADSAYSYLIIGNFFSNALTDTLHFASDIPEWGEFSYTLVDAVCVSPYPEGCERGSGMHDSGEPSPAVFPNPATDVLFINHAAGFDLRVLDMLGQQVWSGKVNTERFGLEVGNWSRGAYVLKLRGTPGVQIVRFVLAE